jgi:hypothetical protein
VIDEEKYVEHRQNYGGKPKYSEKTLPRFHVFQHKSNMDWSGIEPELRGEEQATNRLRHILRILFLLRR